MLNIDHIFRHLPGYVRSGFQSHEWAACTECIIIQHDGCSKIPRFVSDTEYLPVLRTYLASPSDVLVVI